MSTNPNQIQGRLIDPKKTKLARQQAVRRTIEQGTLEILSSEGIFDAVPLVQNVQGTLSSGRFDQPVAFGSHPQFFPDSLSVSTPNILESQSGGNVQNLLETGVAVDDALYSMDLNDVACTNDQCNKRISNAGQERSAGRPGNRPIGARTAARNSKTCLGPYATRKTVQSHTGHNTRGSREASSRLPRQED